MRNIFEEVQYFFEPRNYRQLLYFISRIYISFLNDRHLTQWIHFDSIDRVKIAIIYRSVMKEKVA